MRHKTYMQLVTLIFLVVGLVHLYRAVNNLPLVVGTTHIPVIASWIAGVLALFLSHQGYKHMKAR